MREIIYDESAVSSKQGRDEVIRRILFVAAIVFFVLFAYVLILLLYSVWSYFFGDEASKQEELTVIILRAVFCVIIGGIGALFIFIRSKFAVSFDYEFVSGELRISRANKNRRRPLYRISPEEFLKVGKVGTNSYYVLKQNRELRETRFTKNKTPMEGKDFYYILYSDHLGKQLFIIECREELIKYISLYAARGTVEL